MNEPKKSPAKPWKCLECGRRFTNKGAERAMSVGCPKCGGVDIDLAETDLTGAAARLRSPCEGPCGCCPKVTS